MDKNLVCGLDSFSVYLIRVTRSLHLPRAKDGNNQPEPQQSRQGVAEQTEHGGDGYGVDTEKINRKFQ